MFCRMSGLYRGWFLFFMENDLKYMFKRKENIDKRLWKNEIWYVSIIDINSVNSLEKNWMAHTAN